MQGAPRWAESHNGHFDAIIIAVVVVVVLLLPLTDGYSGDNTVKGRGEGPDPVPSLQA